nr:hypothetical protein [Tanacetum cinerariifolium]
MFDCNEMFTSKTDESLHASPKYDRYHSGDGYHAVPPLYTRTFMPPKPELVFHDAPNVNETIHNAFNVKLSPILTKYKLVPITAARPVTTVVPKPHVTRPRPAKTIVTKPYSPPIRHINHSQSPKPSNFPLKVTTVKASKGNPQHALKDKGVIDSRCSRYMIGNMSYLSDFEEINGGYVAFGGNLKGGKISDTECIVLSPEFKLPDENQVLLRVPRENNMYNVDLKNIILSRDLTCLFSKATLDESNIWHRRLGHINFKTMNKLVKGNLVRGLPSKVFKNNHTCVACKKGKQHRASCKTKPGIKREFSVPGTPQQNGIAKRKNRTLTEAARTMLADFLLPFPFWAEAVNTACYVQNRVLVTKPQNKIPYELLLGRIPSIGFMRPFGCLMTILNTLDHLGKFNGNVDEGFLVGYSNTNGDATFEVEESEFEENKPESKVHVSPSSSAQTKKHDDKTKSVGFPAQSVGYSNTNVLELPCLLGLIIGTSQSRQHGKSDSDSYYLSD